MVRNLFVTLILSVVFGHVLIAQPSTDLWLFDLENGKLSGEPLKITDRDGYDNQPSVSGDVVFYTSQREGQTDIYSFDLVSETTRQITRSAESEYSPLVTPDGKHISVIMVEKDGTQRLWQYHLSKQERKVILMDLKPIGYHVWYGPYDLGVFVLGDPNHLYTANSYNGQSTERVESIGRSLQKIPGQPDSFSFIKNNEDGNYVASYYKEESKQLIDLPEGTQDFNWLNDSTVVTGVGPKLFSGNINTNSWSEIGDLESLDVADITRLVVTEDGKSIILVVSKK